MTTEIIKARDPTGLQQLFSWDQLIDRFISSLDTKPPTIELYRKALNYFFRGLNMPPTRQAILNYKHALEQRKLRSYTINAYLTAIRQFFAWLEAESGFPNPAKSIKGLKQKDQSKDALTGVQCRQLLDSVILNGAMSRRDYAILNLMLRTGLRTIEISRANLGDIQTQDGAFVLWVQGKGRDEKDRFVLLTPEAHEPILDYISSRGTLHAENPLFVSHSKHHAGHRLSTRSLRKMTSKYLKKAGLKSDRISAHSLRHTFVTLAIEGGATLPQVQASARHVSPQTTMRYFHNRDRIKNAAEKVIKF